MLKIYLARHGQDQDNADGLLNGRRDQPLTAKGLAQAKELALKIKNSGISFDAVYSSPLQRARKTAEVITATLRLNKLEVIEDLIERDFGVMTGQVQTKIEEYCSPDILKTSTVTYFLKPEGAETFPDLINRANKILNTVKKKHQSGNVLLVTHGDLGKMIYTAYYKLQWQDVLQMFHFGNSDLLELSEGLDPQNSHVIKIEQYNI